MSNEQRCPLALPVSFQAILNITSLLLVCKLEFPSFSKPADKKKELESSRCWFAGWSKGRLDVAFSLKLDETITLFVSHGGSGRRRRLTTSRDCCSKQCSTMSQHVAREQFSIITIR